jgi:DNA-binding PucR family transcriptional regulator
MGTAAVVVDVGSRLRARLPELTASLVDRASAIADPRDAADEIYRERLPDALEALLEYGVAMVELGEARDPGIPPAVLAEVRLAARSGVSLETIVRRCMAASSLLGDALVVEAESAGLQGEQLRRSHARLATAFDRLLEAESAEYAKEASTWPQSTAERQRDCAKRLLAGEMVDPAALRYELEANHVAVMAAGERAEPAVRELAERLGRQLLAVRREEEPIWACWLGGPRTLASARVTAALSPCDDLAIAVGEPADGLSGWRLSHRQAKAALPLARRGAAIVRYADVLLDTALYRDDLATTSLRRLYLEPLAAMKDSERIRETLRAYFAAERNVTSTAAALGLDRRTVRNRLRAVEDLFGRRLNDCAADIESALRLDAPNARSEQSPT